MIILWIGFFTIVAILLALDLGVFHREAHTVSLGEATKWTITWVTVSMAFCGLVFLIYRNGWFDVNEHGFSGTKAAGLFLTGYLLEYSLSIDNIFVLALLFRHFRVPSKYQHRILYWGILWAVVSRITMIVAGVWLVERFDWIFYVFGGYLLFAGGKMLFERDDEDEEEEVENSWFVRLVERALPMKAGNYGQKFFIKENGRRYATKLFLVLIIVELTDVVFAVDSVPAVIGIMPEGAIDNFIVITSNIFAILGLRSLYFVLAGMLDKFRYLKPALALILVSIGAKMVLHGIVHFPIWASLVVVAGLMAFGVGGSLIRLRYEEKKDGPRDDTDGGSGDD
ncbi:MAG TPA: TerC/Alx family metal homeostasis membrane protein [Kofleriaceae bacterium]|nr:TerC/Alx family metal homeostasis membrane protein [Kofleriaceae bacterium]